MPGSRRRRPLAAAFLSTSLALLATIPLAASPAGHPKRVVADGAGLHTGALSFGGVRSFGGVLPEGVAGDDGSADAAAPATAVDARPREDHYRLVTSTRPRVEAQQTGTAVVYDAPPPGDPPDSDFDRLAQCESTSRWHLNTGNGYYGGLQFSAATWRGLGGTGLPHEHPRETQIAMARRLWRQRGWQPWPHCSKVLGLA